jgi:hypothetical protein
MTPIDLAAAIYALRVQQYLADGAVARYATWDELAAPYRDCYVDMVTIYLTETVDCAQVLHGLWMEKMLKQGWCRGPIAGIDPCNKRHPHLVEWDMLTALGRREFANAFAVCEQLNRWLTDIPSSLVSPT